MRHFLFSRALLVAGLLLPLAAPGAESPRWIWSGASSAKPDEARYFRKVFTVNAASPAGILKVAASGEADVFLNGKELAKGVGLKSPLVKDVSSSLKKGKNVLAIRARNSASEPAGVVAVLEMKRNPKARKVVSTDDSWQSSGEASDGWQSAARFEASGWSAAHAVGTLGDKPWGDVFPLPSATDPSTLTVLPGFKVELLHSATQTEGSWICMTTDQKGRFIISPQADNQPLLRVTIKHGKVSRIEPIQAPIHQAMGLLYAYDSLYASGHGPEGTGLYRLIDANHDDQFETNELHFLSRILGEGEHGYHALMLGPDKKIYMMNGNHTKLPPLDPLSPHKNYQEDLLLPRQWDANGHAVGILAPGGQIFQTDENGKDFKLMLAGFRNSYDFDFNPDGEIFTFDSDMEWDWGLPWYRPTRVCHAITGAEFGWRSGSAKMPAYYPDTLPSTLKIGIGSPTGVKFGTDSDFPEKYRTALFILDWSYGRIFAVHLKPHGASYSADAEVFLRGKPLNLTALRFGKDGSMYFITGGRGTQSGLYRVSYVGKRDPWWHHSPRTKEDRQAAAARAVRHKLESFYARKDPAAIDFAWPYLGSHDRFLSYAARIAIEWQDVNLWKDRALREVNPDAALTGLLALARCGGKDTQRPLLEALKKFPMDSLSITQKLDKLRVIELSFTRQGRPDAGLASMETKQLDSLYPSQNEYMNRELCQLLIYLEAPDVVGKTLALLDKAKTQEEQVEYIFRLRTLSKGWTLQQRKHYFDWFESEHQLQKEEAAQNNSTVKAGAKSLATNVHPSWLLQWFKDAGRDYSDGVSYPKYLINIRNDAIESLSPDERVALSGRIEDFQTISAFKPDKERKFVRQWTVADLDGSLGEVAEGRNYARGKSAFHDAQCMLCHRFGNQGGYIGPELTAVSSKYSVHDILESILEPSKVISDQYQNITVIKKDGDAETGRLMDEDAQKLVLRPNPLSSSVVEIKKSDVAERRPSKVSPMPEGLLNQFNKEDILDMLAYIVSTGKEKAANFKPVQQAKH